MWSRRKREKQWECEKMIKGSEEPDKVQWQWKTEFEAKTKADEDIKNREKDRHTERRTEKLAFKQFDILALQSLFSTAKEPQYFWFQLKVCHRSIYLSDLLVNTVSYTGCTCSCSIHLKLMEGYNRSLFIDWVNLVMSDWLLNLNDLNQWFPTGGLWSKTGSKVYS